MGVVAGGFGSLAGGTTSPVVTIFTTAFCAVTPSAAVTGVGETVQVVLMGHPDRVSETEPVKPPRGVIVALKFSVDPLVTFSDAGAEIPKSQPVPLSGNCCGLFAALSVTVSVPDRGPTFAGLNVTLTVQFAPTFRLAPQVFV
jgi:hypothetical protein